MKQRFFRSLADLRFAIAILLIIASFSIIGTVIEQDQSIEIYKLNYPLTNKVFGFLSWDIILKFGFDHVYKTWWFISLAIITGVVLIFLFIKNRERKQKALQEYLENELNIRTKEDNNGNLEHRQTRSSQFGGSRCSGH